MKAITTFALVVALGILFVSASNDRHPELENGKTFITSLTLVSKLPSSFANTNQSQLNDQLDEIANAFSNLKKDFPALNSQASSTTTINDALNQISKAGSVNCDQCLQDLFKAVFNCFNSCGGPRLTVKACVEVACANYQACKGGQNR
jgi:hypothetical protein